MQCTINDKIATGMGPNKKTAKKNAAENMLRTMGHAPSIEVPGEEEKPESKPVKTTNEVPPPQPVVSPQPTQRIAPVTTAQTVAAVPVTQSSSSNIAQGVNEHQLRHLAELCKYKVVFSDFPKDGRILSLISINTTPPLVAHGDGPTVPLAREEAASKALQELMTRGLGN